MQRATVAELPDVLPAAVAEQAAARHQLWRDTARQRAELAAAHAEDLHAQAAHAARAYAATALAAFRAAVLRSDPLDVLQPPGDADAWDEQRLAPPPETGIHAIDAEARKLHAAAVGAPLPRRGPAPKRRRRYSSPAAPSPEPPGSQLATLADFLRGHTHGGALMRRLHPAILPKDCQLDGSPGHDPPGDHSCLPRRAADQANQARLGLVTRF